MTSSLLIVRLGALGDVVHAMPVVAAVRGAWPDCRIGWLVHQRYAALVSRVRDVDAVYPVRRGLDVATIGAVRAARYEVCLDLQGLMKSAAYARASAARRVIGFSRDLLRESMASLAYGETGGAPGLHVVQQNLSLLRRIGIEPGPPRIDLDVSESPAVAGVYELIGRLDGDRLPPTVYRLRSTVQRAQSGQQEGDVAAPSPRRGLPAREASSSETDDGARKTEGGARKTEDGGRKTEDGGRRRVGGPARQPVGLSACQLVDGPTFVLLNPGAGWPNKQWPAERFGQLAARLRDEADLPSVVLWGPGEASLAAAVVRSSGGAAVMAPESGLDDVLAIARAASVVVAGDTGPLHLAAAVGTPVVGLFGPTPPERNGPWQPADLVVSRHEQCHCVFKRTCTAPTWCLGDIDVDAVTRAVLARLQPLPSVR